MQAILLRPSSLLGSCLHEFGVIRVSHAAASLWGGLLMRQQQ
jgi:hypothetical protein